MEVAWKFNENSNFHGTSNELELNFHWIYRLPLYFKRSVNGSSIKISWAFHGSNGTWRSSVTSSSTTSMELQCIFWTIRWQALHPRRLPSPKISLKMAGPTHPIGNVLHDWWPKCVRLTSNQCRPTSKQVGVIEHWAVQPPPSVWAHVL